MLTLTWPTALASICRQGEAERREVRLRELEELQRLEILHQPEPGFISQRVLIKSFLKSQFPHKSVNFLLILVIIEDKLTNLCGN